jgi:hypothetical protein
MYNQVPIAVKIKLVQEYIYNTKGQSVQITYPRDSRQLDMLDYAFGYAKQNYYTKYQNNYNRNYS